MCTVREDERIVGTDYICMLLCPTCQTLTEGTKVTLTYELNKYTLKVLECKPAKGGHLLPVHRCRIAPWLRDWPGGRLCIVSTVTNP